MNESAFSPAPLVNAGRVIRLLRPYILHLKAFQAAIGRTKSTPTTSIDETSPGNQQIGTPPFKVSVKQPKRTYRSKRFIEDEYDSISLAGSSLSRSVSISSISSFGHASSFSDSTLISSQKTADEPYYQTSKEILKIIRDVKRSFENVYEATHGRFIAPGTGPEKLGPLSLFKVCSQLVGRHMAQSAQEEWEYNVQLKGWDLGAGDDDQEAEYTKKEEDEFKYESTRGLYEEMPVTSLRHVVVEHAVSHAANLEPHPARTELLLTLMECCLKYNATSAYASLLPAFLAGDWETSSSHIRRAFELASNYGAAALSPLSILFIRIVPEQQYQNLVVGDLESIIGVMRSTEHILWLNFRLEDVVNQAALSEEKTFEIGEDGSLWALHLILANHTSDSPHLYPDLTLHDSLSRLADTVHSASQRLEALPETQRRVVVTLAFHFCLLGRLHFFNRRRVEREFEPFLKRLRRDPVFYFEFYNPRAYEAIYLKLKQRPHTPPHVLAWLLSWALKDTREFQKSWIEGKLRIEEARIVRLEAEEPQSGDKPGDGWIWDDTIDQFVKGSTVVKPESFVKPKREVPRATQRLEPTLPVVYFEPRRPRPPRIHFNPEVKMKEPPQLSPLMPHRRQGQFFTKPTSLPPVTPLTRTGHKSNDDSVSHLNICPPSVDPFEDNYGVTPLPSSSMEVHKMHHLPSSPLYAIAIANNKKRSQHIGTSAHSVKKRRNEPHG